MPARTERTAARSMLMRLRTEYASSESVIATPVKPIRSFSRPVTIARDCEAIACRSSAG